VSDPRSADAARPYEPTRPTLLATAAFALWPVLLSLPMLRQGTHKTDAGNGMRRRLRGVFGSPKYQSPLL